MIKRKYRFPVRIVMTAGIMAAGLTGLAGKNISSAESSIAETVSAENSNMEEKELPASSGNKHIEVAKEYEDGWEDINDNEYVYCVGSVSKVYVTAAVMQLVDEGKVELDEPVTTYIPDFKLADERYRDITVRMLMNHTSGIMGTTWPGSFLYGGADTGHHDNFLKMLSVQRLKAAPGEYAAYCNDGFDLLERIVENVSGMSYTEYVKEKLASPTGGKMTGTGMNCYEYDNLVPAFSPGNNLFENDVLMPIGAGGIYATASDVAKFGASFFTDDNTLLSENAKKAMATGWNQQDDHMDKNGLGWDTIEMPEYQSSGVTVLGKGGDVNRNHAYLLVAPGEKISISVNSNGGNSSLNELVAKAILDTCLEEQGIETEDEQDLSYGSFQEIPDDYDVFAGDYVINNQSGAAVCRISFPDHQYVHTETTDVFGTTAADYMLTEDGWFEELAYEVADSDTEDIRVAANPAFLRFERKENGQVYIACRKKDIYPELGSTLRDMYVGERLEGNLVSDTVMKAWQKLDGTDFLLTGDIWSSQAYDAPQAKLVVPEDLPGYLYIVGTTLLKVEDENTAVVFTTVPSSANRDLFDISVRVDGDGMKLVASNGFQYIPESGIPEFDGSVKEIALKTGEAVWYRIGDSMANTTVTIASRSENSTVYVYNKFGEVVYTSHILDAADELPMPKGGKILFLGEDGGSIQLQ